MFFPNKVVDDITITSLMLCFPGRIPMNVVKCYMLNWQEKQLSHNIARRHNMTLQSISINSYCLDCQLETVSFKIYQS